MKKGITTHVLDLVNGVPASNITIELWKYTNNVNRILIGKEKTNNDGRIESSILETVESGEFELVFHVKEYMEKNMPGKSVFFDCIPIRFITFEEESHYHIPLLLSSWGYQTYRGS